MRFAGRIPCAAPFLLTALACLSSAQQFTISTIAGGGVPVTPAAAASAAIGQVRRVVADAGGNLYFSASNVVYKMDSSGTLTLVAGNGQAGYSGDGGPATRASLSRPTGIAIDSSGNVYIADSGNNVVRMVMSGIISTVAGNGTAGYSGNGAAGPLAQLNNPTGLAYSGGVLYICDTANHSIRALASDGTISTYLGNGYSAYRGNGGPGTAAQVSRPSDIVFDGSGNIYIADTGNGVIREITKSDGYINTIAGGGSDNPGDGEAATSVALVEPSAIAVDSSGNLYIAEPSVARIRQVTSKAIISTFAGTANSEGFAGDGSTATKALLWFPSGLATDSGGALLIADQLNNRIRKVTSGNINTIAGTGALSLSGSTASAIQLSRPAGVATDVAGDLFVADYGNQRVLKVAADGAVSTLAGNGTAGFGGDGGAGGGAQLNGPSGVAVDAKSNVYFADVLNNRVRAVDATGVIRTFAGSGSAGFGGDGGAATSAALYFPHSVATDAAGNIYIADYENACIRKVSPTGTIVTVAGNSLEGFAGDGGPATKAMLDAPHGVAVDAKGNLYIADTGNNVIRMVGSDGNIRTIAGNGVPGHDGDGGPATQAYLAAPLGVAVDAAGQVYIADAGVLIRRIGTDGTITTVAGTGYPGYSGDGGDAVYAKLNGASALAIDLAGRLFLSDTWNNVIRVLTPKP
ncbi:MAG: hypothetical protein JSU00_26280 [Acidobacteria bacterium]|nr:hypothetical protein [Acidobacteriota bacterium]